MASKLSDIEAKLRKDCLTPADLEAARRNVVEAEEDLVRAKKRYKLLKKQFRCKHARVDKPGSYFGETCLECGLFLNNGA